MKKHYILGITLITAVGFLAFQKSGMDSVENYLPVNGHTKNAGGAPTGKTGAPGELNCTECHTGSVVSNSSANSLAALESGTTNIVTNYAPGGTYSMTLTFTNAEAMEGFQATALDLSTNSMAGSFPGTNGFGTAISSASGKDYANHTLASSVNSTQNLFWVWEWQAPATDMGPVVFYVATNSADGNAATSGDVIHLSEHIFGSSVGLDEESNDSKDFTAGYSPSTNEVVLNFTASSVDAIGFTLVDMNGKVCHAAHEGESTIGKNSTAVSLPSDLKAGVYVVNVVVGNKAISAKIMIQK